MAVPIGQFLSVTTERRRMKGPRPLSEIIDRLVEKTRARAAKMAGWQTGKTETDGGRSPAPVGRPDAEDHGAEQSRPTAECPQWPAGVSDRQAMAANGERSADELITASGTPAETTEGATHPPEGAAGDEAVTARSKLRPEIFPAARHTDESPARGSVAIWFMPPDAS